MKPFRWIIIGVLAALLTAVGAYFWTMSLMDSMYAYRSILAQDPPAPGEPLGNPLTRKVVIVLLDALREDTSRDAEVMPFLNELRSQAMDLGLAMERTAGKLKTDAVAKISAQAQASLRLSSIAVYLFLGFFALSIAITVLLYYWWKNFQDMILNL